VVSALVASGLVDPARRDDAVAVVDRALSGRLAEGATLRHRLSELAGYVGGAFVAAGVVLFVVDRWERLSTGQQVGLLAGIAVVLAAVAVALGLTGGGLGVLRSDEQPVRRRLAGVLFAGAAAVAAIAAGVQVDSMTRGGTEAGLAGALTLLVLGVAGYVLAPTLLGQAVVAFAVVFSVPQALEVLKIREPVEYGGPNMVVFGLVVLAAGVLWLVLAERRVWREVASARVIGSGMALAGAQIPLGSTDYSWLAYLLTALVAVAGFLMYVARQAWPYIAVGVAGVTLVVPEALLDWFEGAMGPAGVLLVAGVTLLGASLLGLRLRHEVAEQHRPGPVRPRSG
jgi:hypothetical protein